MTQYKYLKNQIINLFSYTILTKVRDHRSRIYF
jgi:hypothetical protein